MDAHALYLWLRHPTAVPMETVAATDSSLTDGPPIYLITFTCDHRRMMASWLIDGRYHRSCRKKFQRQPALIPLLKVKLLAVGGKQSELGRRIMQQSRFQALTPCQFGLSETSYIACIAFHYFAVDMNGQVYAGGLNNFGQTGITQ